MSSINAYVRNATGDAEESGSYRVINGVWQIFIQVCFCLGLMACTSVDGIPTEVIAPFLEPERATLPPVPAFPGAEGWGAEALAASRALPLKVHFVTSIEAEGPGTLAEVTKATRSDRYDVIIFRTGGRFAVPVSSLDRIEINASHVYLAGQTAPGDGVAFDGRGNDVLSIRGTGDNISDVVVRYIRIRDVRTGISIGKGQRVVVDHISVSWARRYLLQVTRAPFDWSAPIVDVSIQNSILSEVLAGHPTAVTLNSHSDMKNEPRIGMANISIHRNLMANNDRRNPMSAADNILIANNVIYNWRHAAGMMNRRGTADWINNIAKAGPMSGAPPAQPHMVNIYCNELGGRFSIYVDGNVSPASLGQKGDDGESGTDQIACFRGSGDHGLDVVPDQLRTEPQTWSTAAFPLRMETAMEAWDTVMSDAGAIRRLGCDGTWITMRDAVDRRVVAEAESGDGPASSVIAAIGWPEYGTGTPCADGDEDGLPDEWEKRYFGCASCADPAQVGRDGYLVIEHYLNGTVP